MERRRENTPPCARSGAPPPAAGQSGERPKSTRTSGFESGAPRASAACGGCAASAPAPRARSQASESKSCRSKPLGAEALGLPPAAAASGSREDQVTGWGAQGPETSPHAWAPIIEQPHDPRSLLSGLGRLKPPLKPRAPCAGSERRQPQQARTPNLPPQDRSLGARMPGR